MMKKEFAPVTPGEMLKEEFLAEYGLLQRSQTTPWFDARWKQPASSSSKRPRCSALVKAPRKANRARTRWRKIARRPETHGSSNGRLERSHGDAVRGVFSNIFSITDAAGKYIQLQNQPTKMIRKATLFPP